MAASAPERTALYRLYSTKKEEGLSPSLAELYPKTIDSRLYLGTAGSCRNGGPGLAYRPCDWEGECVISLGLEVHWGTPKVFKQPPLSIDLPTRTALYRLRDADDGLLYVGISENPQRRWVEHSGDKSWWGEVAHLSIEWFKSRAEAMKAEELAIRLEGPQYNVIHNEQTVA